MSLAILSPDAVRPAPLPAGRAHSQILVARRYLDNGFLDAAKRIFERTRAEVTADDWQRLVDRLLERGRIADAVHVCQAGGIPLPRPTLLAEGDRLLHRKDVDAALHFYELADADADRWAAAVDLLTRLPGRELHAVEVARRRLVS